jgi:EKC/KEOPS complex subunit CGI121/TPRKB
VSDNTTALFVVRITSPDLTDVEAEMNAVVIGTLSPLSDLAELTDWPSIKKVCKFFPELNRKFTHVLNSIIS